MNSINFWLDLETRFLSRFFEDDTEVTMETLLSTVQKEGESVRDYIERFRNLSLYALQACLYLCCFRHVGITSSIK